MRGETLIKGQLEMSGSFQQLSKEVGGPTLRSEKKRRINRSMISFTRFIRGREVVGETDRWRQERAYEDRTHCACVMSPELVMYTTK